MAVSGVLRAPLSIDLTSAAESAREMIEREAIAAHRSIGDYATTLLVARLVRRARTVEVEVLHIGDGVIAAGSGGDTVVVSAPERGEHANETAFLTAKAWRDSVRRATTAVGEGDGVMLMSDGPMGTLYDARTNAVAPACADILAAGLRLSARRYERALVEVLRQLRDTAIDDLSLSCAVVVRD